MNKDNMLNIANVTYNYDLTKGKACICYAPTWSMTDDERVQIEKILAAFGQVYELNA